MTYEIRPAVTGDTIQLMTINGTREIVPSLEDVFISMVDKKTSAKEEKIEH